MELYHFLIDTDSVGARIESLALRHMPPGLDDEQLDRRLEAVGEATGHLLRHDLREVMERVEQVVKDTARKDPDEYPENNGTQENLQQGAPA